MIATAIAAGFYATSVVVGSLARIGYFRARWAHHLLYALNVVAGAAALLLEFQPPLVLVAAVLLLLPFSSAGGRAHMGLAAVGGLGFAWTLLGAAFGGGSP